MTAKLYTGGGELVDHSSVHASQGSFPAGLPRKYDQIRLTDEDQDSRGLKDDADRDDQIPDVPTAARLIGIDPARHAQQSRECA